MTKPAAAKRRSEASAKSKAVPAVARGSKPEKYSRIAAAPAAGGKAHDQLSEARHSPKEAHRIFETGKYPYRKKIKRTVYERQKANLRRTAEGAAVDSGYRPESRHSVRGSRCGKPRRNDQAIHGASEPARAHVVALDKPTEREKSQWFFQRYIEHLPTAGTMVLFDRSWYNRAGVERVGFLLSVRLSGIHAPDTGT